MLFLHLLFRSHRVVFFSDTKGKVFFPSLVTGTGERETNHGKEASLSGWRSDGGRLVRTGDVGGQCKAERHRPPATRGTRG